HRPQHHRPLLSPLIVGPTERQQHLAAASASVPKAGLLTQTRALAEPSSGAPYLKRQAEKKAMEDMRSESPTTAARESSSNTKKGKSAADESTAGEAETQVDTARAADASDTGIDGGASAGRDPGRNELHQKQQQQQQQQQQQEKRPEEQGTKRTQQQPKQQQKQQQQVGVGGNGKGGTTGAECDSNGRPPGARQKRQQRGGVAAGSSRGGVGAEGQERGAKSGQKEKRTGQAGSGLGYVDQLRALQAQMQGAESKPAEIKVAEIKSAEKQRQQQQQAAARVSWFEESEERRRKQGLDAETPYESTQTRNGSEVREVEMQGGKAAAETQQQDAVPVSRAAGERGESKGRILGNGVGTSRKVQVQESEARYPWDDPEEQAERGEEEGEMGKGRRVESADGSSVGNGVAGRTGAGRSRREAERGEANRVQEGKGEEVNEEMEKGEKENGSRVIAKGAGVGSKGSRSGWRGEKAREGGGKESGGARKGEESGGETKQSGQSSASRWERGGKTEERTGTKMEAVPAPTEPTKSSCCGPKSADPSAAATGAGIDVTHADVSEYYGKTVQQQADLQTSACLVKGGLGADIRRLLSNVHDEILSKFYGCGSPIPPLLKGCTVLDLGCGTGRDVYVAAQLVGPTGQVIGIDMTDEQLAVARKHEEYHREKFGFAESNVSFRKGFIEDLRAANVEDSTVDVVVSNCVINLAPSKVPVISEIARVLKTGGELYFSDVFADRRIPKHLQQDKVLFGECLSGALYLEDFRRLMASVGLGGWGVVEARELDVENPEIAARVGPIRFYSLTVRAVKLPSGAGDGEGEDLPENYGQMATYSGSIPEQGGEFTLDNVRVFKAGVPTPVDATTAAMLTVSRYSSAFTVTEKGAHQGPFTGWARFPASVAGAWWSATVEKAKSGCC
ncbi:unnamed protein product, partial [Closterium sp. Naga37s-1]